VQRRSGRGARLPLVAPELGDLFGRGSRVELHVYGTGGSAVARNVLARIEVAVVQGPLDGLSKHVSRIAGDIHVPWARVL